MIEIFGYTNEDFNADYIHWECAPPTAKRELVEVPLRDGYVDVTQYIDNSLVAYSPRTLTIGLEIRGLRGEWPATYSKLMQKLHGRSGVIRRDEDPEWEWEGWAAVGALEDHGGSAGVTITVTAQPYKERCISKQIYSGTPQNGKTFTVNVESGRGVVWFSSNNPVVVEYAGQFYTYNNSWTYLNLYTNESELTVTCNQKVEVYLREMSL